MSNRSEKGAEILDRINYDQRLILEYGTPLGEVVYQLLRVQEIEESADLPEDAINTVEAEARDGRFGAFVLRLLYTGNSTEAQCETIEIWGWATD